MRPSALLANTLPRPVAAMLFPGLLLLGACSGLGHFLGDTEELPGYNPNGTAGVSENLLRARGHEPATQPMLPQAGNVWPGPPQALPTLGDASHGVPGGADVLGGGPTLPRGGSMSMGEGNAVRGGAPIGDSFSGAGLQQQQQPIQDPARQFEHSTGASAAANQAGSGSKSGGPVGNGNIVIPNGDGTSTVISPDGSVKTVKGTPPP